MLNVPRALGIAGLIVTGCLIIFGGAAVMIAGICSEAECEPDPEWWGSE